ncbi:MAG: hypothetical protein KIT22_06335 [Verrucomicrobiae bacterium]|nr:hypothetical protein [Verrucomicrobiae bacterium]
MKPLREITAGLLIALLGMIATVLYIMALSHVFVGRWTAVAVEGILSVLCFAIFHRAMGRYLARLMRRFSENDQATENRHE